MNVPVTTTAASDVANPRPEAWKRSSVRDNLIANLGGKGLSVLISLICVPIYIRVLGIAGYGLIGVWTTLETIANVIDLGLSPTITREMAACSTRTGGAQDARDLVRTLEAAYWVIGVVLGGIVIACASPISLHWLRTNQLPPDTLRMAIVLIGVLIACRWPITFYVGGLTGLERQVVLSAVSTTYAYLRSLGSVFILLFVSRTIFAFFAFQIVINLVQTVVLTILLWRCLPSGRTPRVRPELIRRIWRFAGGATAISLVGLIVSELDKIVVSAMVPLERFGYYALGSRVAASLGVISLPLFAALFPAFSRQVAAGNEHKLTELYHRGAQLMSALAVPTALTVIFFARPIIFAWTGKPSVANNTSLIAALLTAGSAVNCLLNIPYALQLSYGWTRLAFWSNVFALCLNVPLLLTFTKFWGGEGAASVWLIVNLSYLLTDVAPMHRRILKSEGKSWLLKDVCIPLITCLAAALILADRLTWSGTRVTAGASAAIAATILITIALIATPLTRVQMRELLARKGSSAALST